MSRYQVPACVRGQAKFLRHLFRDVTWNQGSRFTCPTSWWLSRWTLREGFLTVPTNTPPSDGDLVGEGPLGPDDYAVLDHFKGKSQAEFSKMLESATGVPAEDFMWMRDPGLLYYLPCVLQYVSSPQSAGNYAFASGVVSALAFQASHSALSPETLRVALDIVDTCHRHASKFDIDGSDSEFLRDVRLVSDAAHGVQ